ncbi:hypothetical protein LTR86_001623 [Recurvomyces mirabilis]|nr:hypothetical protein LTR86_001623 [Recurvomyces mirabilis]
MVATASLKNGNSSYNALKAGQQSCLVYKITDMAKMSRSYSSPINLDDPPFDFEQSEAIDAAYQTMSYGFTADTSSKSRMPNVYDRPEGGTAKLPPAKKQAVVSADIQKQQENLACVELERNAWILLNGTIEVHEHGYVRTVDSLDSRPICSARMVEIVDTISRYAVVREDVGGGDLSAMRNLAADPWAYGQRKVWSLYSNVTRAKTNNTRSDSEVADDTGRRESAGENVQMRGFNGSRTGSVKSSSFGSSGRRRSSAIGGGCPIANDRPVHFATEYDRLAAPVPRQFPAVQGFETTVMDGQRLVKVETDDLPQRDDEEGEDDEEVDEQREEDQSAFERLRKELMWHTRDWKA